MEVVTGIIQRLLEYALSIEIWDVLDILVKDKGIGIQDLEQARRPAFTTGGNDRSGMGFTIMESFMTNVDITSRPGKGTTVHMRRKLQRRQ